MAHTGSHDLYFLYCFTRAYVLFRCRLMLYFKSFYPETLCRSAQITLAEVVVQRLRPLECWFQIIGLSSASGYKESCPWTTCIICSTENLNFKFDCPHKSMTIFKLVYAWVLVLESNLTQNLPSFHLSKTKAPSNQGSTIWEKKSISSNIFCRSTKPLIS